MKWRLALDMGTNSLGWAAFELNEDAQITRLLDTGVRVFSDGREPAKKGSVGNSLAVERRTARGIRKTNDRRLKRKSQILKFLIDHCLLPSDPVKRKSIEQQDPYALRAAAVERPLTPHELGRVLMQLAQRRGFKSNRKSNSDDESGTIKPKITKLKSDLNGKTLGQWLNDKQKAGLPVRFRAQDDFWPDRSMYLDEFDALREIQEPHHSLTLTAQNWDDLRDGNAAQQFDGLYFQRKLKPVERGRCEFFIDEYRTYKDLPIAQDFRILQEVANLAYYDDQHAKHSLSNDQRDRIIAKLYEHNSLTYNGIRKLKSANGEKLFPKGCVFNLEKGKKDKLKGRSTVKAMRKGDMLGATWDTLSDDQQNEIVETLHECDDNAVLIKTLQAKFPLSAAEAENLTHFKLSASTSNVSRKFMAQCNAIMREQVVGYSEAVTQVYDDNGEFLHHSDRSINPEELLSHLPYYGEVLKGAVIGAKPHAFDAGTHPEQHYGKINNPTVHVALNQVRKLVNCLSDRFGAPPAEIHVELVRDLKKPVKVRNEITAQNNKNQKENARRRKDFQDTHKGQDPSGLDLKKMRLWEELEADGEFGRLCPFSGEPISAAMLFNGEAEIEHILPFSRTLDNSTANLTVATKRANRLKGNKTPYEAFAQGQHAKHGYHWSKISERASKLPHNKRWRFSPDAMDRFSEGDGFIARQLTDNAYISRITKRYLSHICHARKIATIPGGLTAMMRGKWHLNSLLGDHNYKERNDHRHHAIDAFTVGLTDRRTLNYVSKQTARGADDRLRITLPDITPLKNQLVSTLQKMVIAYKPDHGVNGKMFKENALGILSSEKQDPDLKDYTYVKRAALASLTEKQINHIRNQGWRSLVRQHVDEAKAIVAASGKKFNKRDRQKALEEFSQHHGVKNIRILVANQKATTISHNGHYKAYAPESYVCVDIWQEPIGKKGEWKKGAYKWTGAFWSYSDCQPENLDQNGQPKKDTMIKNGPIHPAAKFITRLFKHDLIEISVDGISEIKRVASFSTTNNKIELRSQYEANSTETPKSINTLKNTFIRKLHLYPDGRLKG